MGLGEVGGEGEEEMEPPSCYLKYAHNSPDFS